MKNYNSQMISTKNLAYKIMQDQSLSSDDIQALTQMHAQEQKLVLAMMQARGLKSNQVQIFLDFFKVQAPHLICPQAIDICGTGGSGLPRINTSTLSAFILAALGVGVAKHGNRAASGRFGSFDLLESLGLDIDPGTENLQYLYGQKNWPLSWHLNFIL